MTNGKKQYISRRKIINERIKRDLKKVKKQISYKKFVGLIMLEHGVPERFVRDILTGFEFTGKIEVNKKQDKILKIKQEKIK